MVIGASTEKASKQKQELPEIVSISPSYKSNQIILSLILRPQDKHENSSFSLSLWAFHIRQSHFISEKPREMACTSNRRFPEFFKVYLPEHSSERLLIPCAFVTCCNRLLPKNAVLSNHMGSLWHVNMSYIDGGVFFLNGWQKFVRENFIECGDFLIFRYNGQCGFNVKIFGKSACEKIESSANGTSYTNKVKLEEDEENEKEEETKKNANDDEDHDGDENDDNDEDHIVEEEDSTNEEVEAIKKSRAPKQSGVSKKRAAVKVEGGSKRINVVNIEEEEEESTIGKSRARKQSGGSNGRSKRRTAAKVEGGSKRTNIVNNDEEEESSIRKSTARKQCRGNDGGSRKRVVVEEEDEVEVKEEEELTIKESRDWKSNYDNNGVSEKMPIRKIGRGSKRTNNLLLEEVDVSKYIQPRNPFVIAKLRAGPRKNLLPVPSKILRIWQLKLPNLMFFQNDHGMLCPGNVVNWKDGRIWISGWNDFCIGNHVSADDWCICEFLQGNGQEEDVIKVHIIRSTGSRS
ncbi:hypothetical protein ACOSP7_005417 [Xanthoceras sorbifolium]